MARALELQTAAPLIPPRPTLTVLRTLAAGCQACELYKRATQTVFGEGRKTARAMMVGEQPGDFEDRVGRRFGARPVIVPLPHPSGQSRWLNDAANRSRLSRALALIRELREQFIHSR